MDDEAIVKGFDPVIMKRILSFLKPYRLLAALTVAALFAATVSELTLPVIIQRTLDTYLLANWARIPEGARAPELANLPRGADDTVIGGYRYLRSGRLSSLSGKERKALESRGLLQGAENGWYVFAPDPRNARQAAAVAAHRQLFDGAAAAGDTAEAAPAQPGSGAGRAQPAGAATAPEGTQPSGGAASAGGEVAAGTGRLAILRSDLKLLTPAERSILRAGDLDGLFAACAVFFAVLVGVFIFNFLEIYGAQLAGQRVMGDMRMALFRHTVGQSLGFMGRNPVGRLVTRMTNDVETINQMFTDVLAAFLKDLAVMIGVFVVLFTLNMRLALITLCTVPPVVVIIVASRVWARDAYRRQRLWMSRVNAYLSERLSGIQVVKLFAREKASGEEFGKLNENLMKANLGEMYVYATFRPLLDQFASVSMGAIIYFGAGQYAALGISLGVLIAFINLIGRFYDPIRDISEKYTILQSAMAGGERVFQILDTREEIPNTGTRELPPGLRGHIEFEHVRFSYKKGEEVIRDLTFHVNPGETAAIVGYTGAGKTTIINLLTRLWDIDSGTIRLDGIPIGELELGALRRAVQPVMQDVILFSGTVMDNIRIGDDVGEERAREAARTVHADEFIEHLPNGYDTVLSEGATNISAGQRQLISFARVVARDPRVIVLDEATSSIDTETERLIQRGMEGLLAGRTSIVIAHRLSTIQHADRIFVMSAGRLVEEGSHQELLKARGLYYTLYRLQYQNGFCRDEGPDGALGPCPDRE